MHRVSAMLWKELNSSDLGTLSGKTRNAVFGGGQPDLRLSKLKVPPEAVLDFLRNSPHALVENYDPVNVTIQQHRTSGSGRPGHRDEIQIKEYGRSRPNDISMMRQHPGYTNTRWESAAYGEAGDYIFILRLSDGSF